jgi:hypothetical protein
VACAVTHGEILAIAAAALQLVTFGFVFFNSHKITKIERNGQHNGTGGS